jgi:hypothetical protein
MIISISTRAQRTGLLFLLLAAAALAAAACGDDGAGSDAGADADADADTDSDADADAGSDAGPFQIDPQRIYDDVAWLADDAREGREAGTAGNRAALDYVAAAFEEMGLTPAGDDGTYFDAFTYPQWREISAPSLVVDGEAEVAGVDYDVLRYSPSGGGDGALVFAGYGIIVSAFDAAEYPDCPYPEAGYNDFDGLDLTGATVLRFANAPNNDTELPTKCPLESGTTYAADQGAVAVITTRDYLFPIDHMEAGVTLAWDVEYPIPVLNIGRAWAQELLPDLQSRFNALSDYTAAGVATEHTVSISVETEVADAEISNVLGAVPGTDAALASEVVIVGGHIDHVGRELGSDAIYNGADDNASGTAVMMELARAIAAIPGGPRRTVVFAAWNAEESGLHGSCAYAASPHTPLERTIAVMNLDAVGGGSGTGAYLIGGSETDNAWLFDLMSAAAVDEGISFSLFPTPNYDSSDHSCFYANGVPAVTMQTLGDRPNTHTQYDEMDVINTADLEKAARLTFAALGPLASGTEADFE